MANSILEEKEYQSKAFDRSCWMRMLKILWEEKKVVICLLAANLAFALTDIIFPLFNRYAIDMYVVGQASQESLPIFIAVICRRYCDSLDLSLSLFPLCRRRREQFW